MLALAKATALRGKESIVLVHFDSSKEKKRKLVKVFKIKVWKVWIISMEPICMETISMELLFGNTCLCLGKGKTLTFIICILGWLKSVLRVVLLCFGVDWQIYGEKWETGHFWKIQRSMPRRRSARLSVGLHLGIGTHA